MTNKKSYTAPQCANFPLPGEHLMVTVSLGFDPGTQGGAVLNEEHAWDSEQWTDVDAADE